MPFSLIKSLPVIVALIVPAIAGKRGLVWPWFNDPAGVDPTKMVKGDGQVVFMYNYETYAPKTIPRGVGFIGMQRTMDSSSSPVNQLLARQKAQGWANAFSLNEPDISGISPQQAGELVHPMSVASSCGLPSRRSPFACGLLTGFNPLPCHKGLPAVTSSTDAGKGLSWLHSFISACAGRCYSDYINLHWYGPNFAAFKSYIQTARSHFPNTNIVVTEFALTAPASQAQQNAFFQQALPFLDGLSYVVYYSPFVATTPALLQQNDPGAVSFVGTGSCLYSSNSALSPVGNTVA